jgi:uncharacterized phage-like protein YoqJ
MTNDSPAFAALKAAIREQIIRLVETENVRAFICGMALGIDTVCCEIVLELKQIYPDLTLQAALPCSTQDIKWSNADRDRFRELLGNCDNVHIQSAEYTDTCMLERNYFMVDHADYLLAVWTGTNGGTAKTVKYAQERGVTTIIIDPDDYK